MRRTFTTERAGLAGVLVLLVAVFGLLTNHFLSWTTVRALANQAPDTLLVATGMTLVILTGGIDLSVGSLLALSSGVFGVLLTAAGVSLPVAALGALGTGAACGWLNGWITVRWRLPSFLVTLATLEMARGGAYLVTSSQTVYLGPRVDVLSSAVIAGLGLPILGALAVVAAGQFTLQRTVFGRQVFAVGASAESARLAGISPGRVRIAVFTISGLLAGAAAVVQAGRLAAADPNAGMGLELEAIAAVVIGGTSLTGGRGSVLASALGAMVILVLGAGLAQMGVGEPTRRLVTGTVIVLAAIADYYRGRAGS
jgi:ribose transport system permease protein